MTRYIANLSNIQERGAIFKDGGEKRKREGARRYPSANCHGSCEPRLISLGVLLILGRRVVTRCATAIVILGDVTCRRRATLILAVCLSDLPQSLHDAPAPDHNPCCVRKRALLMISPMVSACSC